MSMKHIKTTDTKTGAVQLWAVAFNDIHTQHTSHLLVSYGTRADLRKLDEACKHINRTSMQGVRLTALSLTDVDAPANERTAHRGYTGYRDEADNDKAPFEIRGKAMGEICASIGHNSPMYFCNAYGGNGALTTSQHKWFNERFGTELRAALTPELLSELKRETCAYIVRYAKNEIANYRHQLDQIEAYEWKAGGA